MTADGGKLLGEYLRDVRPLARWQVVEGLRDQVIARDGGRQRLLGEILVALGFVQPEDVETALRRQRRDLGHGH